MHPLRKHPPTNDQLVLIRDNDPGNVLVRGAAGSGKTTTALLRLELITRYWIDKRTAEGSTDPIRVLALAFNRTLVGYIRELASAQVPSHRLIDLEIETVAGFDRTAANYTGTAWDGPGRDNYIWSLGRHLGFSKQFLVDEVDYVLGRFPPERITEYVTSVTARLGRGRTPLVSPDARRRIHEEVLVPFAAHKSANNLIDWNDLAVAAAATTPTPASLRQIVVIDEAQDFSVNQMRSVVTHLAPEHSLTVVTDTAQRIYPRYLYYPEAGLPPFDRIYTLPRNFRNTPAIAAVAAGILNGLTLDEDAAPPIPASSTKPQGPKPTLMSGLYSQQMDWVLNRLSTIDLTTETAAILALRGRGSLNYTRRRLEAAGLDYIDLQQVKDWPAGSSNLGLSTLHSAKGLEFDHVFILGLIDEFTEHDNGEDDATLDRWRRLLGMAVGRARMTATLGYQPLQASRLIDYVDRQLVEEIDLDKD